MTAQGTRERPAVLASRPRRRGRRRARPLGVRWLAPPWPEALLVLGLFAFALAVRWPYLLRLPHFTDEIGEVRWALSIWRGEQLPLTAQVNYAGPLHAYIIAACLWLFGPHLILPRLVVMVGGALTVAATYLLGRELAGWLVGLLAAALLATNPQHIVVNSHVAWQNSTTPLYTTLSCWALARALNLARRPARVEHGPAGSPRFRARDGLYFVLGGLCCGLALQTHLGALVLAPALVATFLFALWRDRAWSLLRRPGPHAAVVAALVAYSPPLLYNLAHGLAGLSRVEGRNYAFERQPTWASYWRNLQNLVFELARMISNPMRIPERRLDYLTSPYLLLMAGLCLLGLVTLARRRQPLPLFATLGTLALMPRFNHAYGVDGDRYLVTGRYVAYLLPLTAVAVAAGAIALSRAALRALSPAWRRPLAEAGDLHGALPPAWRRPGARRRAALLAPPALVAMLLVLYPLLPLERYYTHEARQDPDNASFLDTVRFIEAIRQPGTPVLVDTYLDRVDLKDGDSAREVVDVLLTLADVPHENVDDPVAALRRLGTSADPRDTAALPLIVMMYDHCYLLRDELPLQQTSERYSLRELYWEAPSFYAVYRYAPPPEKAGCYPP